MPLGFEIFRGIERPPRSLLDKFRDIPTPDLADVMHKRGAVDTAIRAIYRPIGKVVGPAVTISVPDAAFDIVKTGLEQTQAGDVVVINARGNVDHALLGDNVCRGLKARGLAGVVVDGAVRDVGAIQADEFPVFARGVALMMGPRFGAGEVNAPIAFGGVVVNPGDIVVADQDGIAIVPPHAAVAVLEAARALNATHQAAQPDLLRGEVAGIGPILERVAQSGAEFHDDSYAQASRHGSRSSNSGR